MSSDPGVEEERCTTPGPCDRPWELAWAVKVRRDESTLLQFRHLLDATRLAKQIFAEVERYLAGHEMKLSRGAIVDATIIATPPSTKNRDKARNPEMHQTLKGNQWLFGGEDAYRCEHGHLACAHISHAIASISSTLCGFFAAPEPDLMDSGAHLLQAIIVAPSTDWPAQTRSPFAPRSWRDRDNAPSDNRTAV